MDLPEVEVGEDWTTHVSSKTLSCHTVDFGGHVGTTCHSSSVTNIAKQFFFFKNVMTEDKTCSSFIWLCWLFSVWFVVWLNCDHFQPFICPRNLVFTFHPGPACECLDWSVISQLNSFELKAGTYKGVDLFTAEVSLFNSYDNSDKGPSKFCFRP